MTPKRFVGLVDELEVRFEILGAEWRLQRVELLPRLRQLAIRFEGSDGFRKRIGRERRNGNPIQHAQCEGDLAEETAPHRTHI